MSKAGAIAALGVGGSGAAITTAYLSGAFGWNYDLDLPDSLENFGKAETKVQGCVLNLFPSLQNMSYKDATEISNDIGTDFLSSDSDGKISGCLVVNWDKGETSGSNKKWKGNFRFLWAVKDDKTDKGFVAFAKASTKTDNSKKLSWEGVVYEIKRNGTDKSWTKTNKQIIKSDKELEESALSTKFPKANDALEGMKGKSFWGFISEPSSGTNTLGELCGSSDDCTQQSDSFKGYWEWAGSSSGDSGGKTALENWTSDLATWWNDLFAADTNKKVWKMGDVVKDKKGTWSIKNTTSPQAAAVSAE